MPLRRGQPLSLSSSIQAFATQIRRFFPLVLFFALLYGLIQAGGYLYFSSEEGQIPWELRWLGVSEEIVIVAPLVALALFSIVSLGFLLLAALLRRKISEREIAALLTWLSAFGLLNLTGSIHILSALILASGLATAAWNMMKSRGRAFLSFVYKSLPVVVVSALILGTGVVYGKTLQENSRIDHLAKSETGSPNILLIVLDTLRADHLSAYGYARTTSPHIDRLAQDGVLFEHAYASSSWTVPSHASMFTGQPVSAHQADGDTPLDETYPTIAEELTKLGYNTAGFVANTYWAGRRSGFSRGFIRYEDYFSSPADMASRTIYGRMASEYILPRVGFQNVVGRKSAQDVNEELLHWLDDQDQGSHPFFAFLNYMDVHDPYIPPPGYKTVFSKDTRAGELVNFVQNKFFVNQDLKAEEVKGAIDAYDSSLLYLDAQIGALLEELEGRGLAEDTWIILVSDHGESFGEKGIFGHGNSLSIEQIHVPMVWHYPRMFSGGLRVEEAVSLTSLPATILSVVTPGSLGPFPGPGLLELTGSQPGALDPILSEKTMNPRAPQNWPVSQGGLKSLVTERWHLIQSENGDVELYDLQADPHETNNLAGMPEGQEVIQSLTPYFSEDLEFNQ